MPGDGKTGAGRAVCGRRPQGRAEGPAGAGISLPHGAPPRLFFRLRAKAKGLLININQEALLNSYL